MAALAKRDLYRIGGPLLLVALGLAVITLLLNRSESANPPVIQATAQPRPASDGASPAPLRHSGPGFIGVVLARESVDLATKFEGRLESVSAKLGDHVKREAVVATLDSRPFRQELAMAEAGLRAAEAEQRKAEVQLSEARKRLGRVAALGGVVSEQDRAAAELDEKLASSALEVARAHVDQETARSAQLKEKLQSTDIRAPFDGTVAARYQDAGSQLSAGAPILRVIRSDDLWVRFAVPEEDLAGIVLGQAVNVNIPALKVAVSGTIEQIAPEVDSASQMVVVEAKLDVPAGWKDEIQSGLVGRVSLTDSAPRGAAPARSPVRQ